MNRITSIFSFIDSNDKVVDVGCDQAKLGIMLAENGIKSIACDIKEIVIENAKKKINELNLNNYIDLRVSDGLEKINKDETDTLVLAGMGTYTMLNILSNSDILFKKIITISNNNHEILRTKMSDLGYKIFKEQIIKENNKYYNLIVFIKGKSDYTKEELLLGVNHVDKEMFNEYKEYLKNKYTLINNSSSVVSNKINKYLKVLK